MHERGDADAEAWVLATLEGRALLAEVAPVLNPGPADLTRWRKAAPASSVGAAIRIARSRRRGHSKFLRADSMWLEWTALQQATAEDVARHKAARFRGGAVVDLCCGIGGDTLALASGSKVIAVDIDPGMCRRARWNAEVYGVGGNVLVVRGDAETFPIPTGAMAHIDPDRRLKTVSRATWVESYSPGPETLRELIRTTTAGAIKLGPASDFEAHFGGPGFEVELISLRGECKEATVWYGGLASCRRRATRLPEGATWTDRDGPGSSYAGVVPARAWVFDPDPALLRAGLVDAFAQVHSLSRIAAGVDYLTASDRVVSPFLDAFEVLEVFRLDVKTLRKEVASRGIGTLEVKVRGLDHRPEEVRSALKPEGDRSATLLLAGPRGNGIAVLARRWPVLPSSI